MPGQPDCRVDTPSLHPDMLAAFILKSHKGFAMLAYIQHLITTCICNLGILPRLTFTWSNLGKGSRVQFCRAFCSDFDCPCGLHMHLPKIAHGAWRKHNRCTRNGIISKFHLTSAKTAKTLAALLPQLNFHIVGSRSVRCGVIFKTVAVRIGIPSRVLAVKLLTQNYIQTIAPLIPEGQGWPFDLHTKILITQYLPIIHYLPGITTTVKFGQCVCGIWGFKTVLNLEGLHGRAGLWPSLRCFILSLLTLLFRISTLMVLIVSPSFGRPLALSLTFLLRGP